MHCLRNAPGTSQFTFDIHGALSMGAEQNASGSAELDRPHNQPMCNETCDVALGDMPQWCSWLQPRRLYNLLRSRWKMRQY